jgi:dTDP-4-dehydrorhamnose reductase
MQQGKPKALVLGGSGFLGINFLRYCEMFDLTLTYNKSIPAIEADWRKFDYPSDTEETLLGIIKDTAPNIIINCIALADVDQCESDLKKSEDLNSLLPRLISSITKKYNIKFVHISTDHFQSREEIPRPEDSELWPINVYGKTKILGEKLIVVENPNALILRTNFFGFSYRKQNTLMEKIISNLKQSKKFNGYSNVAFNPVSVIYLIRAIEYLYSINSKGILNIVSKSVISKYDFAKLVAQIFNLDTEYVVPSISPKDVSAVDRPTYLALSPDKYEKTNPPRIPDVREMLIELKEDTLWLDELRS